jgi:hypothetical protein
MPLESISLARLAEGHPELSRRIQQLATMCEADGVILRVTMVLRTYAMQAAIYAQGRQDTAAVNALRAQVQLAPITDAENAEKVTNAPPGESAHQFGYAADVVPDMPGNPPAFDPDWDVLHPSWSDFLAKALTCGLAEGAQWTAPKRDYPHLYLNEMPANPTPELQNALATGGLTAVFQLIDKAIGAPSAT